MDIPKPARDNIPLIPRSQLKYHHDAQHVLMDVFQEMLEEPTMPDNVIENIAKYEVDSIVDKSAACTMHAMIELNKLKNEELQIVEEKLCYNIIEQCKRAKEINANPLQKQTQLLKRNMLFPKIDEKDARKFNLIRPQDFLPTAIHQSIDFTYVKKNECNPCTCPSDLDLFPTKLPSLVDKHKKNVNKSTLKKLQELCGSKTAQAKANKQANKPLEIAINSECFRVDKDMLVFANYELNVYYKKRFRVMNISKKIQKVVLSSEHELKPCFQVISEMDIDNLRLSSGISAPFTVLFKPENFHDVHDYVEVNGHKVELISYRQAPDLSVFLLRFCWPMNIPVQPEFDVGRAEALNCSIECGSCFVGEKIESYLIFKNNGGVGKFFMMTEMQWSSQDINSLHDDLQLDFGSFTIQPNYFELDKDEFIIIRIEFFGTVKNSCVENLVLICNNITWVTIDFIADVIIFDKYSVYVDNTALFTPLVFNILCAQNINPLLSEGSSSSISEHSDPQKMALNLSYGTKRARSVEDVVPTITEKEMWALDSGNLRDMDYVDNDIIKYLLAQEMDQDHPTGSVKSEENVEAPDHVAFFGQTLGGKKLRHTIAIYNNTMINLKYRWEMRETHPDTYHMAVKPLQTGWLKEASAHEGLKYLPAYERVQFDFVIKADTAIAGYYAMAMCFIVEEIPKCAVRIRPGARNFLMLERDQRDDDLTKGITEIVDVQVYVFDAMCRVLGIDFHVQPLSIFGTETYELGTLVQRQFKLQLITEYREEMSGCWVSNQRMRVMVNPEHFTIEAGTPLHFTAEVDIVEHGQLNEEITLVIGQSYTHSIPIHIEVEKPHLKFNRKTLNFGLLIAGNSYERTFKILNGNFVNVDWEIREQYRKELDRPGQNFVTVSAHNLECGDVEIKYLIKANAALEWVSSLVLYTIYENVRNLESRITIYYEIVDAPVEMHTQFAACPLLAPAPPLYVGQPKTFLLCFHNPTNTAVPLEMGTIYGDHCDCFDIAVIPSAFKVPPKSAHHINITLVPSRSGEFHEIFIAFNYVCRSSYLIGRFIEPRPIVLSVMLSVDDIRVKLTLPANDEGKCTEILWPPQVDSEYIGGEQDSFMFSMSSHSLLEYNDAESVSSTASDDLVYMPEDVLAYLKTIEQSVPETRPVSASYDQLSTFSSDTIRTDLPCAKFDVGFENLSKHILTVCGVPTRRFVQYSIKLENLTPVPGILQIDTFNFPDNGTKRKRIDNVLQALNMKTKADIWEERVGPHGILVQCECLNGINEIAAKGSNEIIISIFATTWGNYKEQLSIDFNNILPLNITLLIEVVGIPILFPIAVNNIHNTAILRYGSLPYKSDFEIRQLQMKNTSVVPINVVWHIYMRHTQVERAEEPITVLFDIFHPDEKDLGEDEPTTKGNVMILHGKCIGMSETRIFRIGAKETNIKPGETAAIRIGFNSQAYAAAFERTAIEAYLIGYVQLAERHRFNATFFHRPTGSQMPPAKAKITAALELPMLRLDMIAADLHIALFADKVIAAGNTRVVKYLTFKNLHNVDADVRFEAEAPLKMDHCDGASEVHKEDGCYATCVKPGESTTLAISYAVTRDEIFQLGEQLYGGHASNRSYYDLSEFNKREATFSMTRNINIMQRGFISQYVECTMTIYFPMANVAGGLDFEQVWIRNVKKMYLSLYNYSACSIEFTIEPMTSVFQVPIQHGIIAAGSRLQPTYFDLPVVFIPQTRIHYKEKMVINTQIPDLKFEVELVGLGRYDEKFYKLDTC